MSRTQLLIYALFVALVAVAGCRRPVARAPVEGAAVIDAGLVALRSPLRLTVTEDNTTAMADGVSTRVRVWEGRTSVFALAVASFERSAPFTGPRDRLLASSMGERIRGGSLGPVTYDYRAGIFTAHAEAHAEGASAQVVAFMSRYRLVVVVSGGRAEPVTATMRSIDLRARTSELFFAPSTHGGEELAVAWGLGFSCRMPGGVRVEESGRGTLRYSASGGGYAMAAYVYPDEGIALDTLTTQVRVTGTVLEDDERFDGGLRYRRIVLQSGERWNAWWLSRHRSFHISGVGTPTDLDREQIDAFFHSCVF